MFNDKKPSVAECCRLFDDSGFYFAGRWNPVKYFEWRSEIPQLIQIKLILVVGLRTDGRSRKIILGGSDNSQGKMEAQP